MTPELVRLSVGIEDIRDILADLDQAIEARERSHGAGRRPARNLRHNRQMALIATEQEPPMRELSIDPAGASAGADLRRRFCAIRAPCCWRAVGRCRPTLHYAVYGRLNAARDNAVLVCHALSGSALVGPWWPEVFAPGGVAFA